jgi:hypothetical protein
VDDSVIVIVNVAPPPPELNMAFVMMVSSLGVLFAIWVGYRVVKNATKDHQETDWSDLIDDLS